MNMMTIDPALAILGEKGLTVALSGGRQVYYNYYWLRDNCPSSFDAITRERSFDIFHLDQPPRPAEAHLDGEALVIRWQHEDHVTRLPLAFLETYAEGQPRPDPADIPRRAWYADHYPEPRPVLP